MAFFSTKEIISRSRTISSFTLLLIVSLLCTQCSTSYGSDALNSEFLKVPSSKFLTSLKTTLEAVRHVSSLVSKFAHVVGDFRLSNAISDCLDLLDLSSDALTWSASATQNPQGKDNSTGHLSSDVRAWLSAALSNPETCIDGFESTHSFIKGLVSTGVTQIISSVHELLSEVEPEPEPAGETEHFKASKKKFPYWVKKEDRKKLLTVKGTDVDVVVAADGSGNYTKVMDAVLGAPEYSMKRYVIYVKKGVYNEYVEIKKKKWNLMMIGDGMGVSVISGNRNYVDGWTTFRSATFAVSGRGFIAKDITFENTAGPEKHQAVALRSDSDLSVFYKCEIRGYQDSLYTHTMRQFFRECQISGTVDFIFGDATAVFQNCQIQAKKGLPNQKNTITAHGRKDLNEPTGFSIQFSNITADSNLIGSINTTQTYLGRPWKQYSRTIFMQSYISEAVRPEGWLEWNGNFALDTLYYAEYMNYGPGAGLDNRVRWPGYHILNDSTQASNFTVSQFIEGELWLPSTGVKYNAGLMV